MFTGYRYSGLVFTDWGGVILHLNLPTASVIIPNLSPFEGYIRSIYFDCVYVIHNAGASGTQCSKKPRFGYWVDPHM